MVDLWVVRTERKSAKRTDFVFSCWGHTDARARFFRAGAHTCVCVCAWDSVCVYAHARSTTCARFPTLWGAKHGGKGHLKANEGNLCNVKKSCRRQNCPIFILKGKIFWHISPILVAKRNAWKKLGISILAFCGINFLINLRVKIANYRERISFATNTSQLLNIVPKLWRSWAWIRNSNQWTSDLISI